MRSLPDAPWRSRASGRWAKLGTTGIRFGESGSCDPRFRLRMGGNVSTVMPGDDEQQVSWLEVRAHAPVRAAGGEEVGRVLEVAALPEEDIFHGVVFRHGRLGRAQLAPAADIARITESAVHLKVDAAGAAAFEEFQQLHVSRLGLRGIFRWKHLGWTDSPE